VTLASIVDRKKGNKIAIFDNYYPLAMFLPATVKVCKNPDTLPTLNLTQALETSNQLLNCMSVAQNVSFLYDIRSLDFDLFGLYT
tara:strand:- start:411 stop:665 length:255 start_codon:yes stop_codon:yes gene_type:complete